MNASAIQPASDGTAQAHDASTGYTGTPQAIRRIRLEVMAVCRGLADNKEAPAPARKWARSVQSVVLELLAGEPSPEDVWEAGDLLEKIGGWSRGNEEAMKEENRTRTPGRQPTQEAKPAKSSHRPLERPAPTKRVYTALTADDSYNDSKNLPKRSRHSDNAQLADRGRQPFHSPWGKLTTHNYRIRVLMPDRPMN
ncbi:MAG: hypothetical protein Q9208_002123 [Pyrenodesmia sp. 3 TL-2023]